MSGQARIDNILDFFSGGEMLRARREVERQREETAKSLGHLASGMTVQGRMVTFHDEAGRECKAFTLHHTPDGMVQLCQAERGFIAAHHSHASRQTFHVLEGEIYFSLGPKGRERMSIRTTHDDPFTVQPGVRHGATYPGGAVFYMVTIPPEEAFLDDTEPDDELFP